MPQNPNPNAFHGAVNPSPAGQATPIQMQNDDSFTGSNADINALATAPAGSQSHKACVSSAGNSAGFPVKQVQVTAVGGTSVNFSNPA
jgi:hypothetical protein